MSGAESELSPLMWEPGAVPAMKPFLQMETSERDDIPQGLAKCYMNHTDSYMNFLALLRKHLSQL